MGPGKLLGLTGIAIATVSLSTTELLAQANPASPVSVTANLTTRAAVATNKNLSTSSTGTTTSISETLSFGITSETKTQALSLTGSAALRYFSVAGGDSSVDFDKPRLTLSYSQNTANSGVSLSANYRKVDVIDAIDEEDAVAEDLIADTGTLTTYGANVSLQGGKQAPLSYSFNASFANREYAGVTSAELFDTRRTSYGATVGFRFSPVTTGTLRASISNSTAENATASETQVTSYSFGLSHELRRALNVNASIGMSQTETTEGGATSTSDRTTASLNLRQGVSNGSYTVGLDVSSSGDDNRTSLSFGRSLDLRDGSLSASLTASQTSDDVRLLGNLNYQKDLPRGSFNVGLTQSITTNEDDEDIQFSRLGLGYSQQLTSSSNLNLSMNLTRSEDGGAGSAITRTRSNFSASYSQELTPDWDLSVGYTHGIFEETGSASSSSDSVFMTLTRGIALGF